MFSPWVYNEFGNCREMRNLQYALSAVDTPFNNENNYIYILETTLTTKILPSATNAELSLSNTKLMNTWINQCL